MSRKVNTYRFSLSFSPDDPEQRKATEILNRRKRDKCRFIAAAILFYEKEHTDNSLEFQVRMLVEQILSEKGLLVSGQNNGLIPDAPIGAALLDGLNAFCKKYN